MEQENTNEQITVEEPDDELGTSLSTYLREIGNTDLLKREQEKELTRQIEQKIRLANLTGALLGECGTKNQHRQAADQRRQANEAGINWRIAQAAAIHLVGEIALLEDAARCENLPGQITLGNLTGNSRISRMLDQRIGCEKAQILAQKHDAEEEEIHHRLAAAAVDCALLTTPVIRALGGARKLLQELDAELAERGGFQELESCERSLKKEYDRIWSRGMTAQDMMVKANLRLVVALARKQINRGVPFEDLIQDGNIGLINAVERFDHRRGHKFSTYAAWWIIQGVNRSLDDQGRTIRLPAYVGQQLGKMIKAQRQITAEQGNEASWKEVAQQMNIPEEQVENLLRQAQSPLSIDQPLGNEEETNLGRTLRADDDSSPERAATRSMLQQQIEEALETLTSLEKEIIQLHFGLGAGQPHTLTQIAKIMEISREKAQSIENRAMRKLRSPERAQRLMDFLE